MINVTRKYSKCLIFAVCKCNFLL